MKSIVPGKGNILGLYYDYEPISGLDADGAQEMVNKFTARKAAEKVHQVGLWIPREHLLLLLNRHGRDELKQKLDDLEGSNSGRGAHGTDLRWYSFDVGSTKRVHCVVGLKSGTVHEMSDDVVAGLFRLGRAPVCSSGDPHAGWPS